MEVKVSYSKVQFKLAVDFIAKNNKFFIGKYEEIEKSLLENIKLLSSKPDQFSIGTMGFTLIAERLFEDLENDENACWVEILIDPAVSLNYTPNDYHEEIIKI